MKKLYTLAAVLLFAGGAVAQNAQSRVNASQMPNQYPKSAIQANSTLALGDTLFFMPLPGYFVNSTDSASFNIQFEDIDGLNTNNAGWPMDFGLFYSLDSWDYLPGDNPADSAFFLGATSWFNPPGQADNWMEFGPITVPAAGATLHWYVKTNPTYRDGYEVLVSTTGMSNYTDFTAPAIYSRADCYPCTSSNNVDTLFQPMSVEIPTSYNGQQVYIAFHHDANDMDVLFLDQVVITEGATGVEEVSGSLSSAVIMPNPAKEFANISYALTSNEAVSISIYDVTGKQVSFMNEGNKAAGTHTVKADVSALSAGVYYCTVKAGANLVTKKLVVVK